MKKFLSLVLALVMTMSLVTISAGAKDFTDDSTITYKEAVDVLSAVKVIDGYTDGAFKPNNQLNRGQAAKILCNMILGPTTASALKADTAPFKDVPADSTFAAYITYCAKEGIIDGYTDGTFRPSAPLTGYAFMKLLLGALGYDKDVEGYNQPNWSINVAKQALGIGLDDGLTGDFDGTKIVTREEACLYALNTMKATMVEYDAKTSVSVGGAEVVIAGSKAKDVANSSKNDGNIKDDGKMQFAEKYFSNLKKVPATDAFNRPATNWKIKSESVGTYVDEADLTYTSSVKLGDIYADLGLSDKVPASDVEMLEDGVTYQESGKNVSYAISKGDAKKIGGDGVITEVFYDNDKDTAIITMMHVYAGKVVATHAATSNKDAYITVAPKWTGNAGAAGNFETEETYAVDDVVLYSYSKKTGEGVQDVRPAETKSGTLTGYTEQSKVVVAGETVKANETIKTQITTSELGLAKSYDVTLVMDENGYVVYVDTDNALSNYAVVLKISDEAGDFNSSIKAELLFTDGTTETVSAKMASGFTTTDNKAGVTTASTIGTAKEINAGEIVRYTVNNKNEYTLTLVADKDLVTGPDGTHATTIVTNGNSDLTGLNANVYASGAWGIPAGASGVYANGKTTFLVATLGNDGSKIYTVYTGIKNVPTLKTAANNSDKTPVTVFCKDGDGKLAKVVYVDLAVGKGSYNSNSKDTVILLATSNSKTSYNDGNGTYYLYDALVNGKLVEDYKVSNSTAVSSFGLGKYPMYTNATVSEDVYTLSGSANANGVYYGKGTKAAKEGVVGLGTVTASGLPYGDHIPYADDVEVFVIDDNGDLTSETSLGIGAVVDSDVNEVVFKVTDYEVTTILVIEPAATKSSATDKNIDTSGLYVNMRGATIDLNYTTTSAPSEADALAVVTKALKDAGYTIKSTSMAGGVYTFDLWKNIGGIDVDVVDKTFDTTSDINAGTALTVNGKSVITKNTDYDDVIDEFGLTGTAVKLPDGTFVDATDGTAFGANTTFETGYFKAIANSLTAVASVADNTITYTIDGTTVAAGAFKYVKAGAKIVTTVTIGSTGYTPAGGDKTISAGTAAAAIKTAATVSGGSATAEVVTGGTGIKFTNGVTYKSGVYTFTEIVAGVVTSTAVTVA